MRYYFNLRDGTSYPDLEGHELPSLEAAKVEAVKLVGAMLKDSADEFWRGEEWKLEVADETGHVLFTLNFSASMAAAA